MVKIALEMVETVSGMHLEAFESKIITFWVILKPRFGHEKVEFWAFSGKNEVVFCLERVQNDMEMVQKDPLGYLVPLSHFRVPYRLKTTNLSYLFIPKLSLLNCFYWNYFVRDLPQIAWNQKSLGIRNWSLWNVSSCMFPYNWEHSIGFKVSLETQCDR